MKTHPTYYALLLALVLGCGCGKKPADQQTNVPDPNPPAQPSAKPKEATKQPPTKPKEELNQPTFTPMVEPRAITLTPGIEAAEKAYAEGNNRVAARIMHCRQT